MAAVAPWTEGVSLLPVAEGAPRPAVAMEYAAEGTITPMVALREGAWKYIHCPADPDMLFDLNADPEENTNLATDPRAAEVLAHFQTVVNELAKNATGSANRIARLCLLSEPPTIDKGEITDKGSINQRSVLTHRADTVAALHADTLHYILKPQA